MYFTLKDESSRIDAVMFSRFNRLLKFTPQNGDSVLVRCAVSMYEIGGKVQLYVKEMQPDGIGSLFLAFEQLREKLEREGLFRQERKRKLPKFPRTVGVITSPSGAAVRDIVTTISRRSPLTNVLVIPATVQGEEASLSVARAIERANERGQEEIDVLIVGRGGGSLEELWAFNEEIVARAIYHSAIPVISAVGHETDVTIADFVADVRAATPTAAAELAVPHMGELADRVGRLTHRLCTAVKRTVRERRITLNRYVQSPVMRRPLVRLQAYEQRVDWLHHALCRSAFDRVERKREQLANLTRLIRPENILNRMTALRQTHAFTRKRLYTATERYYRDLERSLSQLIRQLDALSPLKVMERGYSIVYREKDGQLIKKVSDVQLGDILNVHLVDGKLDCQVWGLEENDDGGEDGKQDV